MGFEVDREYIRSNLIGHVSDWLKEEVAAGKLTQREADSGMRQFMASGALEKMTDDDCAMINAFKNGQVH
ncbi:hypothetical protein KIH07_18565 [Hydrogenophaga taeniospiralis]|uniref:hypothetical protein n=1 Tax=Hydrogenophaga taeniospiralis TaxID=65656 RepID=UPI001CFBF75D|nr:hypothetical protein [Hydrogenophaga taeniospiralis]MCB4365744.1 hypothetical protein [Hydrogenophaga taeniospiralis]